jgi:hypothetical protein
VTCSAPALTRHCCCGLCLALLQAADLQLRAALAAAEDAHEQAARKIAWRSAELEEEQGRLDEEEANRRAGWRSTMEGERLEMAERMEADYRERMAVAIKVRKHACQCALTHSVSRSYVQHSKTVCSYSEEPALAPARPAEPAGRCCLPPLPLPLLLLHMATVLTVVPARLLCWSDIMVGVAS